MSLKSPCPDISVLRQLVKAITVRVKQLLQTAGNPFAALITKSDTGRFVAVYNNRTGKYELIDSVEKSLYQKLLGKAAEVKTQIERENRAQSKPSSQNETIAG